jgi:hypothetical protein
MATRSQMYMNKFEELKSQREDWENEWEDIRDFILPRTGRFEPDLAPGQEESGRYSKILDGTATRALRVLAAGMQGGLTSPARPWFRLGLYDQSLLEVDAIGEWLDEVQKRLYTLFSRSNFYNTIHRLYKEETGYGQAVCIIEEDELDHVRFQVLTAGEYYLVENERGIVDTVYRTLWMQSRQMQQKFGLESLPEDVKQTLIGPDPNEFTWFQVLHVIRPRKNFNAAKLDSLNMPYESVYIALCNDNPIIGESGYKDKPFAAPRWETNVGDSYGRSPGHDVLPDVKMLQEEAADYLSGLQKQNEPPLKGTGGLKHEVSHMAGTITYTDDAVKNESLKPIYEVRINVREMKEAMMDTRQQIREGLYNDLFLMLIEPKPNMTATEVAERHEEKLLMLGPVIERQFYELLTPIIDRGYAIAERRGLLPPPPQELLDAIEADPRVSELKVEYISLLAQAQKLVTTQSIKATSQFVASMAEFKPEGLDKINIDAAIEEFAEATGAPATMINSDEAVALIREERAARQAAEQEKLEAQQAAEMAKTMGQASTEEQTALGDLKNTLEGV